MMYGSKRKCRCGFEFGDWKCCLCRDIMHKNKNVCMKVLRARLFELEIAKKKAESQTVEDSKLDIAWGSQIRSYVLQPYRLAKDHRTKVEVGDVDRVLNGDLDKFIKAYLQTRARVAV